MSDFNLGVEKALGSMNESSLRLPEIPQFSVPTGDQQESLVSTDNTYDNCLVKETNMKIKEEVSDEVTIKEEPMNGYVYDVDTTEQPFLSNCELLNTFRIKKESRGDNQEVLGEECDISVGGSDFGIQNIFSLTTEGADWRQGRIPIDNRNIQDGEQQKLKSGVSNKSKIAVDTILTPMRFVIDICDKAKLADVPLISLETDSKNEMLPNSSNVFKDVSDSSVDIHLGGLEDTPFPETPIVTDQNPLPLYPLTKPPSSYNINYECPYCPFSSTNSSTSRRHIMGRHTGEKPYKCILCGYSSVNKSNVKKHVNSHLGYKPYRCAICTFKACQPSSLQSHMMHKHNFSHSESLKSSKRDDFSPLPEAVSSLVDHREYESHPPSFFIDLFIESNGYSSTEYSPFSKRKRGRKRSKRLSFNKTRQLLAQLRKFKGKEISVSLLEQTEKLLTQQNVNIKKNRRNCPKPLTYDGDSYPDQLQAIENLNLQTLYPRVMLEVQNNCSNDVPDETPLSTTFPDPLDENLMNREKSLENFPSFQSSKLTDSLSSKSFHRTENVTINCNKLTNGTEMNHTNSYYSKIDYKESNISVSQFGESNHVSSLCEEYNLNILSSEMLNPKVVLKRINIKEKIYYIPTPSEESAFNEQLASTELKKNKTEKYSASELGKSEFLARNLQGSNSSGESLIDVGFLESRENVNMSSLNMRLKNQSRFIQNSCGKISSQCFVQKEKFGVQTLKKYKCLYCFYTTAYRNTFTRHVRSKHTGEKPFKCSLCSYRSVRKDYLKKHLFNVHCLSKNNFDEFMSEDPSNIYNNFEMNETSVCVPANCPDNDLITSHLSCQLTSPLHPPSHSPHSLPPHSPPNSSLGIIPSSTTLTSPIEGLNMPTTISSTLTTVLTPSNTISTQLPTCISNQHPAAISSPPVSISSQLVTSVLSPPPILTPPPSNFSSQQSNALSPIPPFSDSSSPPASPPPISPPISPLSSPLISPVSSPPQSPQRSCSPVSLPTESQIENKYTLCTSEVKNYSMKPDSPSEFSQFSSVVKRKLCHSQSLVLKERRRKSSNLANLTINEGTKTQISHSTKLGEVKVTKLSYESEQRSIQKEHSSLASDCTVNSVDVNGFPIQCSIMDKSCLTNTIPFKSQSEAEENGPFDKQFGPKVPLLVDNSLNPKVVLKKLNAEQHICLTKSCVEQPEASLPFTKLKSSSSETVSTLDPQEKDALPTSINEKNYALPHRGVSVTSDTFMGNSFVNESNDCKPLESQQNSFSQNANEKCPHCSFFSKYSFNLERHKRSAHSIPQKCSFCLSTFSTKRKLLRHVKNHKNYSSSDISSQNTLKVTRITTTESDTVNKIPCTSFGIEKPVVKDENTIQSPPISSFPENGCDILACDSVSSTDLNGELAVSENLILEEQNWSAANLPSDTVEGSRSCNLKQDFEVDPQVRHEKNDSNLKGNKPAESFEVVSISSNTLSPKMVLRRLDAKKVSCLSMVSGESLGRDPSPPCFANLNFKSITPSESKELKDSDGTIKFLGSGVTARRVSKNFKAVLPSRFRMKDILKRKRKKLNRELASQRNKGKCPYCSFLSVYAVTLSRHISAKHVGVGLRKCPLCPFKSIKRSFIKRHLTKVHSLYPFSSRIPVINPTIIIKGSDSFKETCSLNSKSHHDLVEMNTNYSPPLEIHESHCNKVISHSMTSKLKETTLETKNNCRSPISGFENLSQNSAESSIASKNVSVPQSLSSSIDVVEEVSTLHSSKKDLSVSNNPKSCKVSILDIEKYPISADGINAFESDSASSLNSPKRKLRACGKYSSKSPVQIKETNTIASPNKNRVIPHHLALSSDETPSELKYSRSPTSRLENLSQNSAESSNDSKKNSVPQSPSSSIEVTENVLSLPSSKKKNGMSNIPIPPESCKPFVLRIDKCHSSADGSKVFENDSAPSLNPPKKKLNARGKYSSFKSPSSFVPVKENYSITVPDYVKIKESRVVLNAVDSLLINKSKGISPVPDTDMEDKKSILAQTIKLESDIPDSKDVSFTGSSTKPKKLKWYKRNRLFIREKRTKRNCPYCNFSSFYFQSADRHIMTNHPSFEPFKCDWCSFTSHFKQVLNRHFYKHRIKNTPTTHTSTNVLEDDPKLNQSSNKRREKTVRCVLPRRKIFNSCK